MVQLYRWFQQHTSLFVAPHGNTTVGATMRQEVTVAREERTFLGSQCLDICPLCGRKLPRTAEGNKRNDDDIHIHIDSL